MELRAASEFAIADLTTMWNLAYTDYFSPIQFTEAMLTGWLRNGDFDLAKSVVAVDGAEPVGLSLLGVRSRRGWIGGFGIAPAYRGRGLAQELFFRHLSLIREQTSLEQVQLEVLVQNWARKVYERAGFAVTRRLTILQGVPAAAGAVRPKMAPPVALLSQHYRLHGSCRPVWQREISWIEKSLPASAEAFFAGPFEAPTGFLLVAPAGEGLRIIDGAALSTADAAELVAMLGARYPGKQVTVVNEPEGGPLHQALTAAGLLETNAQWEMHWHR